MEHMSTKPGSGRTRASPFSRASRPCCCGWVLCKYVHKQGSSMAIVAASVCAPFVFVSSLFFVCLCLSVSVCPHLPFGQRVAIREETIWPGLRESCLCTPPVQPPPCTSPTHDPGGLGSGTRRARHSAAFREEQIICETQCALQDKAPCGAHAVNILFSPSLLAGLFLLLSCSAEGKGKTRQYRDTVMQCRCRCRCRCPDTLQAWLRLSPRLFFFISFFFFFFLFFLLFFFLFFFFAFPFLLPSFQLVYMIGACRSGPCLSLTVVTCLYFLLVPFAGLLSLYLVRRICISVSLTIRSQGPRDKAVVRRAMRCSRRRCVPLWTCGLQVVNRSRRLGNMVHLDKRPWDERFWCCSFGIFLSSFLHLFSLSLSFCLSLSSLFKRIIEVLLVQQTCQEERPKGPLVGRTLGARKAGKAGSAPFSSRRKAYRLRGDKETRDEPMKRQDKPTDTHCMHKESKETCMGRSVPKRGRKSGTGREVNDGECKQAIYCFFFKKMQTSFASPAFCLVQLPDSTSA